MFQNDRWHGSINDGRGRIYFAINGPTYYKASGTNAHIWRREDDYTVAFLQSSGNLYANAFVSTSDERIKKNIVDIDDTEALEQLLLIETKKYIIILTKKIRALTILSVL